MIRRQCHEPGNWCHSPAGEEKAKEDASQPSNLHSIALTVHLGLAKCSPAYGHTGAFLHDTEAILEQITGQATFRWAIFETWLVNIPKCSNCRCNYVYANPCKHTLCC